MASANLKTSGVVLHAHNAIGILFLNFQTGNDLIGQYACRTPPCNNNYGGVWLDHAQAHFENSEIWAQADVLRVNDSVDLGLHYTNLRFGTIGLHFAGGAQGSHCTQSSIESNYNNFVVDQSQDAGLANNVFFMGAACAFDTSGGDNVVINTPLGELEQYICDACSIATYGASGPGNAINIIQAPNYSFFTFTGGANVGATDATGATATLTIGGGSVTAITPATGGHGFWLPPKVSFTNVSANAKCTVEPTATATVNTAGAVTGYTLLTGGSGCAGAGPFVNVTPTGNLASGASALTNISGGSATSVSVLAGGQQYISAPSVLFTGGACAVEPTGTATISGGAVTAVALVTNGSGCIAGPQVVFYGGAGNAQGNGIVLQDPSAYVNVAGASTIIQNGDYGIAETFIAGIPNNIYVDPSVIWQITSIPNGSNMSFNPAACGFQFQIDQLGCPTTFSGANVANIGLTGFPSTPPVENVKIVCNGMSPTTNGAYLQAVVGVGATPTYVNTYPYTWLAQSSIPSSIATGGASNATMDINDQVGLTNINTDVSSFTMQINNINNSAQYKDVTIDSSFTDASGNIWQAHSSYSVATTSPITAFKIFANTGNVGGICTMTPAKL
jgi:hypothetical protein